MGDFSVGCFGKLPIYPDFIRHNAVSREVSQLDQWFQEGIHFAKSRLGQGWPDSFRNSGSWNFLFQPAGAGHFLLGVYIPSRDYGGRLYPFFLYLLVDRAAFSIPVYFAPMYFSTFLDKARDMVQSGWSDVDIKEFLSRIGEMTVAVRRDSNSLRDDYLHYLQDRNARELWTTISGDFGHPRKYQMTQNLADILQPLRHNPVNKFGLGLKFPLFSMFSENTEEAYDIPFWFDMTSRLLKQDMSDPVLFWNRKPANGSPCMLAFLSQPSPRNFLFMINPDMDCDYWYDLAPDGMGNIEKLMQRINKERKELLDNGDISLSTFLEAIGDLD